MPIALEDGLWWPVGDKHCRRVRGEFRDVERALKYVEDRTVCVQAGGNCGLWARYLAGQFQEVWTIEADFNNYRCLLRNCSGHPNVRPVWAALTRMSGYGVELERDPENIGAHYVNGNGGIGTLTIDELELEACDLITLDIEGMEPHALAGAARTIERFKPVLMVEDKGLSIKYGWPQGWAGNLAGYRVVEAVHRDVVLVPC